jgi:predicted PurR-regulated permease PerM
MEYRLASLLLILPLLTHCAQRQTRQVESIPNPMPAIWQRLRSDIDNLEARRSPHVEWRQHAESAERIASSSALESLISYLAPQARTEARQAFQHSASTWHYGFEGNHHALVNYSVDGRPLKVIKW